MASFTKVSAILFLCVTIAQCQRFQQSNPVVEPDYDYAEPAPRARAQAPSARATGSSPLRNSILSDTTVKSTTPPVAILKQINRHNEDGSYTYGYEGGDGSFKIETKLSTGEVMGKYGYVDDSGKVRVVEYGANKYGFQPSGEGITVPEPNFAEEVTEPSKKGQSSVDFEQYDEQIVEAQRPRAPARAPARTPARAPTSRPAPSRQQFAANSFQSAAGPSSPIFSDETFQPRPAPSRPQFSPEFQSRPAPTRQQFAEEPFQARQVLEDVQENTAPVQFLPQSAPTRPAPSRPSPEFSQFIADFPSLEFQPSPSQQAGGPPPSFFNAPPAPPRPASFAGAAPVPQRPASFAGAAPQRPASFAGAAPVPQRPASFAGGFPSSQSFEQPEIQFRPRPESQSFFQSQEQQRPASRGEPSSILDQLAKDYSLPQGGSPALHDITFSG